MIKHLPFSERVKRIRATQKLTMESFAKIVGVSKGSVSLWESSKVSPPKTTISLIDKLFGVASAYDQPLEGAGGTESQEADETYSTEEQILVRMLIEITRGRNAANREAIKSSINAFWLSRNMGGPQEEQAARSAMPERPVGKRRRAVG